jgi:hypothetical protein
MVQVMRAPTLGIIPFTIKNAINYRLMIKSNKEQLTLVYSHAQSSIWFRGSNPHFSRIDEPMEGEVFDVQDHTRRTGTSGPVHMGI